jgi:DNA-binding GntR family transcriptional regulator
MELTRVDTQKAYQQIRQKIISLELAPGAPIDEASLAQDLNMGEAPVREALKLLAHDHLVDLPPRGIYVTDINIPDLEQLSEIRLLLESFCARQAAERATPDILVVLEALCKEPDAIQPGAIPPDESQRLLDLDHKFHQTIARSAQNRYLAETLERLYGLSQRLWHLAIPQLHNLPAAVGEHLELVQAIKDHDADKAEQLMHDHVQEFYAQARQALDSTTAVE